MGMETKAARFVSSPFKIFGSWGKMITDEQIGRNKAIRDRFFLINNLTIHWERSGPDETIAGGI